MLLRQAGSAAARLAAARASLVALPPVLRLLVQQSPPPTPPPLRRQGDAPAAAAASRAVAAAACRATGPSASSSRGLASSSSSACGLTASDRHDIIQLIHRFDDYLNRERHAEIGAFFVGGGGNDGNNSSGNGSGSSPQQQPVVRVRMPGASSLVAHEGVPAIVAFFTKCAPMARGNRHLLLNSVVEEEEADGKAGGTGQGGGRVAVRSSRLLVSATNPPALRASGVIEDVVVRAPSGEWRFLSRDLLMDPPAAAPAA